MKNIKGIVLAGGSGTRLSPMTNIVSKQLLPIYDKPMIYYPLATLMLGGIREILLISTPRDVPYFQSLLGDGSQWGISIEYCIQEKPRGLAEAFLLGRTFLNGNSAALILGDNIFYGKLDFFRKALANNSGGTIFAYHVNDPERYGVVEFAPDMTVLSIEEKPEKPKSNYAIPGLYVFDHKVCDFAETVQPSLRGELEITEIHNCYLREGTLRAEVMGRGIAWLDTGTPESLLEASSFIQAIEKRQGYKIACLEEIALIAGYITPEEFMKTMETTPNSSYREYCLKAFKEIVG